MDVIICPCRGSMPMDQRRGGPDGRARRRHGMLGMPFQASYSMPLAVARLLSGDVLNACERVQQQVREAVRLAN